MKPSASTSTHPLKDDNSTPSLRISRFKSVEHLKISSTFFNRHRRQNSMNELTEITENLSLNNTNRKTRSPDRSRSPIKNINDVPLDIKNVSNFETSPSRSFTSPSKNDKYQDLSPSRSDSKSLTRQSSNSSGSNSSSRVGNFLTISSPKNPFFHRKQSLSTFTLNRIKRKISSFMDSDSSKIHTEDPTMNQRPKTSRSCSNSKTDLLLLPLSMDQYDNQINESGEITTVKEANRRRSRTLGSLESDLYNKRNGSLVRTIGSMVLLKSTGGSPNNSDEESINRPSTPPRVSKDDTVESYLEKLMNDGFEFEVSSILSAKNTPFFKDCLYKFLSTKFDFTNEALDIALRRMLIYCELPKESQHIDRFIECFGEYYYSCNKDLWKSADQVYFLTFSFVMLHTDYFNLDNKKRMTKDEFVKNTRVEDPGSNLNNSSVPREVLEYFYDNITHYKFSNIIQHIHPSSRPTSIYLLPKRMFSNSTTHLMDSAVTPTTGSTAFASVTALNNQQGIPPVFSPMQPIQPQVQIQTPQPPSQQALPPPRSMSISSTTSQFFSLSSSVIDPYHYFINNNIESLFLQLEDINYENPFQNKLAYSIPETEFLKYYRVLKVSESGTFFRYNKGLNWLNSKIEFKRVEREGEEFVKTNNYLSTRVLLKIIKAGEIYREETNSKFFPSLGSSTKTYWKRYYGILTSCGLFLFENLNFLTYHERELIFNNESIVVEFPDSALKSCLKYSINGLFAVQFEEHNITIADSFVGQSRFTFDIFSTNKREVFSTMHSNEMISWIISINLVASLDNCLLGFEDFQDHEIVPIRNISITEKIQKLNKNSNLSTQETKNLLETVRLLKTLAPFNPKTKENLLQYFNSLNIRIDWLWYEIERNLVYIAILKKFQLVDRIDDSHEIVGKQIFKSVQSLNEDDDFKSISEDSFISEDIVQIGVDNFDDISTVEFLQRSDDEISENEKQDEDKPFKRKDTSDLHLNDEEFVENTEFDNDLEEFVTSEEHPSFYN